ncbi:MAG TPA: ATP-binding protein [Synergistaceae bacterium]|nr:ATP-binding protein [Synergistaceae bacterium]
MKELLVISGKGGTGKTSITVSLAALAENAIFADCDVDAADMALILKPQEQQREDFYSGSLASIDNSRCMGCGKCYRLCRFDAIRAEDGEFSVDPLACEGCGVCYDHCPVGAISFDPRLCGDLYVSSTSYGPLVHARLGAGGENSGKLVSEVKKRAKALGEEQGRSLMITDGPPGIGCSVIASLTGADAVLIVTEPTVSGMHDLERVYELCKHFRIPAYLCVNKADLNAENTQKIRAFGEEKGVQWLGEIPYDASVTRAMIRTVPVVEMPDSSAGKAILTIWEMLKNERTLFQ